MAASTPFRPVDEQPHPAGSEAWWAESWAFDVWTADGVAACTCLTVLPNQQATWYWTALVRPGQPLVHLADLRVPAVRPGLEVRTDGLWASHTCEAAFEQWTVANEAYAVALDEPADALGRALGVVTPIAFDLEWYAAAVPEVLDHGYAQDGSVDGVIELAGGPLDIVSGASRRVHRWGVLAPAPAAGADDAAQRPPGAWVPFLLEGPDGPEVLDRVAGPGGWWERRRRLV